MAIGDHLSRLGTGRHLLSAADEVRLAQEIETGILAQQQLAETPYRVSASPGELHELADAGMRAFTIFVESNLRLVVSIARPHAGRVGSAQFADLIQAGNLALITSIFRFDFTKGFKFSTYASWWIRKAISEELNNLRAIRLGHRYVLALTQFAKAEEALRMELGREPRLDEVAAELDIPPEKIVSTKRIAEEPTSLNRLIEVGSETEFGDLLPDPEPTDPDGHLRENERKRAVGRALQLLEAEEARVLCLRFGLESPVCYTQADVADVLGIGVDRERALEKQALTKLRHPSRHGVLVDLL